MRELMRVTKIVNQWLGEVHDTSDGVTAPKESPSGSSDRLPRSATGAGQASIAGVGGENAAVVDVGRVGASSRANQRTENAAVVACESGVRVAVRELKSAVKFQEL
ncbi:hypothetical protein KSP40_PGU018817 [Platanthera guangdongensis]|uniref:Uncharacterized protein n=1 Tax=Platanthera guangdongensis TaxID=2320717 RepID=A0ABR2MLJ7_9ASPA